MRETGIQAIKEVPWGTHLCSFYRRKEELLDLVSAFIKTGLEQNEYCLWVTSFPLTVDAAMDSLTKIVPDADIFVKKGQLEIIKFGNFYLSSDVFEPEKVLERSSEKLLFAFKRGFEGMRITGDCSWVQKKDQKKLLAYESMVSKVISGQKVIALCTYPLDYVGLAGVLSVGIRHQNAIVKHEGAWVAVDPATFSL